MKLSGEQGATLLLSVVLLAIGSRSSSSRTSTKREPTNPRERLLSIQHMLWMLGYLDHYASGVWDVRTRAAAERWAETRGFYEDVTETEPTFYRTLRWDFDAYIRTGARGPSAEPYVPPLSELTQAEKSGATVTRVST